MKEEKWMKSSRTDDLMKEVVKTIKSVEIEWIRNKRESTSMF